jgi:uncharacterized SAM-binding protein YcdF (DUF218 family)
MRRAALILAGLVLLASAALGWGFLRFLDAARREAPPPSPAAVIIVLTGGAERVDAGLRLLDEGLAPVLLVTGANRSLTLAEFARAHGRDAASLGSRVVLGRAAATTIGNAAEAAAFLRARGVDSALVVTAGYHMPRAMLELRRALPEARLQPQPVQPAALRPDGGAPLPVSRRWTLMLGEFVKYGAASAGISRLIPARESARR